MAFDFQYAINRQESQGAQALLATIAGAVVLIAIYLYLYIKNKRQK